MGTSQFYDDLADYYDLIYADWEGSMARQGEGMHQMLAAHFPQKRPGDVSVLDVSAGIGTQALPLARLGYRVTARDLSPGAIERLSREADVRGLSIDAGAADMRSVAGSLSGRFDSIICMDNAIPHLQTDEEILSTLQGFQRLLVPGGAVLVSVRDYDKVDRAPTSTHPYGERIRGSSRFRVGQQWEWLDASHYRTTFLVEELQGNEWVEVSETSSQYYAIPIARLIQLMGDAGFEDCGLSDVPFFQPVLTGTAAV
jgi:SAM-dependent methyltransferase